MFKIIKAIETSVRKKERHQTLKIIKVIKKNYFKKKRERKKKKKRKKIKNDKWY